MMADKIAQLDDPRVARLYDMLGAMLHDWDVDEPVGGCGAHLTEAADLLHELLQAMHANGRLDAEQPRDAAYTNLMDTFADDAHPSVARLRELLAQRGWTGWTRLERRSG